MNASPASGRMTWAQAVAGPLAGTTCLWQDLDGLHVEAAPDSPPPTSIVWGWRDGSFLVRVRLDGDRAYVAIHEDAPGNSASPGPEAMSTVPWAVASDRSEGDLRIAASHGRGPSPAAGGVGARYEQVIADGIATGAGPITFVRPVSRRPPDERHRAGDDA